ncbi:MAG: HAD family hydrolase [Candidatus Dadabacteria bacterium]|nr:HAD family hydrolase [Candidatus Dadabacteria bacterium]
MKYEAVIFDLDGTLVDSVADIAAAANSSLLALGFAGRDVDEYKFFIGGGAEEMIKKALPPDASPADVSACLEGFMASYREAFDVRTKLYDGMDKLLCSLSGRGVKLAVLSNKPHEMTSKIAVSLLSRWDFAEIVGHSERTPRKPDPAGAEGVCRRMGVAADKTALVGDSAVDMETAVAAGMLPVGVLWGFRGRDELVRSGARHVIGRPEELEGVLE